MTNVGDIAKAINAQNVLLYLGTPEAITIFNITKVNDFPINRINSRQGAADFPSNPLREITWDAIVSKDLYDTLTTLTTLSARSVLPLQACTLVGQSIDGSSDITATFSAIFPHMEELASDRGAYTVRVTMRIANSTYSAS